MTDDEDTNWYCPNCGYAMLDTKWINCNFDYPCPRCETPISQFERKPDET